MLGRGELAWQAYFHPSPTVLSCVPFVSSSTVQEIAPAVGKELCFVFESQWLRTRASLGDMPIDHLQPSVPAFCHPLPAGGAPQQAGSRRGGGPGCCVPPPPPPVGGCPSGLGQPVTGQRSVYSGRFSGQQQDSVVAPSVVPPPPPSSR